MGQAGGRLDGHHAGRVFGLEALIALPLSRTTTTTRSSHQGLHRIAKTNEQFPTACSQPAPENGLP